jgi:hypothetical protein
MIFCGMVEWVAGVFEIFMVGNLGWSHGRLKTRNLLLKTGTHYRGGTKYPGKIHLKCELKKGEKFICKTNVIACYADCWCGFFLFIFLKG